MRSQRAILVAILALTGGCTLAQMQVSAPLDVVPAVPVDRGTVRKWNDPVSFGAWHTTSVDEGGTDWTPGRSAAGHKHVVQNVLLERIYRLTLATPAGAEVRAGCFAQLDAATYGGTTFDVGTVRGDPALQCTYDGAVTGSMDLFEMMKVGDAQAGYLEFDDERWHIQSVDRIVGSRQSGAIVGYEIRNDEAVIGAVETINHGRVWIAPFLTSGEQDRVAAVVATLLLYRPLKDELEAEQSR